MIQDLALRWLITLMFVFSAGVCISSILRNRHSAGDLVSHSLHAIMAIAMAVMAWPSGAALPTRAPMIFFAAAAVWFAVTTVRTTGHRGANVYHTLMMLAMAWMYAAMGGLPLRQSDEAMSMSMPMGEDSAGHAGHAGHGGHSGGMDSGGMHSGTEAAAWVGTLNWLCALGFAAATAFWFYRLVTARVSHDGKDHTVGILCQLAMAAGMAIMFGVML